MQTLLAFTTVTGRKRNRLFSYADYIEIMKGHGTAGLSSAGNRRRLYRLREPMQSHRHHSGAPKQRYRAGKHLFPGH